MADKKDLESLQEGVNSLEVQSSEGDTPVNLGTDEKAAERIQEAVKVSKKSVVMSEKAAGDDAELPKGPVGLDIGTSHIVVAQNKRNYIETIQDLNAFFTVPNARFAEQILKEKDVMHYEQDNQYYIIGYSAQSFANMFNGNTRRPMKEGFLTPNEEEGLSVIKALVNALMQKPKKFGEILCFTIPGEPLGGTGSVVYHESVIKGFLGTLGYSPISINEGMAVVVSELSEDDFTGIGISMGGGMCNICLSYLSFPVVTYSVQKAGDYIDAMVGTAVGEPATKIKVIKEEELDLTRDPKDRVLTALDIFYNELIVKLLESLQQVLSSADHIPKIKTPIPIVLSGGTAMPKGCKERFEKMLENVSLPVKISAVRLAEDLLNTPAKGALTMAMTEAE
jgi:actin-related protein